MGKNKRNGGQVNKGALAFDEYYKAEYGERWGSLRSALFVQPSFVRFFIEGGSEYFIGRASALVALLFSNHIVKSFLLSGAQSKLNIADMCSAPGGKALVTIAATQKALFGNKKSKGEKESKTGAVGATGAVSVTSEVSAISETSETNAINKGSLMGEGSATSVGLEGALSHSFSKTFDKAITYTLNDTSSSRAFRLKDNIHASLPPKLSENCRFTVGDGSRWCLKMGETFDALMLDAPCSSERHVITNDKYLSQWSASRVKSLAIEQFALLNSARLVVKSGGFIMYATCALAGKENDGVVARLLDKDPSIRLVFESEESALQEASESFSYCDFFCKEDKNAIAALRLEQTPYGFLVLPDENEGGGPMYFSLLQKA